MSRFAVRFSFTLPPTLLLLVPQGSWGNVPRGCSLEVAESGEVTVTSIDGHESYARNQVMVTAKRFLRCLGVAGRHKGLAPEVIEAVLSAPSCRERPETWAIALGATVSIAYTRFKPMVA
jgi:hypothetical protein